MVEGQRPTEPAVDVENQLKTLAWIARYINERFPPIGDLRPVSRQLLHKAWKGRDHARCHGIRFPEAATKQTGNANGGDGYALFRVGDIVWWYTVNRGYRIDTTSRDPLYLAARRLYGGGGGNDEDTPLAA